MMQKRLQCRRDCSDTGRKQPAAVAAFEIVDGLTLTLWGWAAERTLGRIRSLTGPRINRISGALMVAAAALLASKDRSQGARQ